MLYHKKQHTNRIHDCEYCSETFEKKPELRIHIRDAHRTELKTYECDKCSEKFPQESMLQSHLAKHYSTKVKVNGKRRCRCTEENGCSKCKGPQKRCLCAECGKAFRHVSELNRHIMIHTDYRPFACTKCPQKFKAKEKLKRHLFTHSNERNYGCDLCEKTFTSWDGVNMHKCK